MQLEGDINAAVDSEQKKNTGIRPRLISYIASFDDFKKPDGFNLSNVNEDAITMSQYDVAEECGRHFSHMNPRINIAWPVLFDITDNSPYFHIDSPSLWLVDFDGKRYYASKVVDFPD